MLRRVAILLFGLSPVLAGCGEDDASDALDATPVLERYAEIAHQGYSDSLELASELRESAQRLIEDPSEESLASAKAAWIAAREPYLQTEVFRFYDGPIDNEETGPEGRINAWPLDENYIDYTVDEPDQGIINDPVGFPQLTKQILADLNERNGEKNIATGYHAVEFLLWGQDLDPNGPGARPFTDYVTSGEGTNANQERRAQYLNLSADLLTDDLSLVVDAWRLDGDTYAAELVRLPAREALRRILTGMGALSGAELSGERMLPAHDNQDQEDEHSCFSDTTHRDMYLDAVGIQNVYLGRYAGTDGPGVDDLLAARDPELAEQLAEEIQTSIDRIEEIPIPFDAAIRDEAGRERLLAAARALQKQSETIADAAAAFGISLNLQ